jgi:hypothetical protein
MAKPERAPIGARPLRLLHQLAALLTLPGLAQRAQGVAARRNRQRLALAQRLLDPLPVGLQAPVSGERFWTALRWGGAGLLVAWLLQR